LKKALPYLLGFFLLAAGVTTAWAQDENDSRKNLMIEVLVETIAEQAGENDENIDYNTLVDDLLLFSEKPLNLNTATLDDLQRLVILNDIAITSLLAHREAHGKLLNILELQGIKGFTPQVIRTIMPFVVVTDDPLGRFNFKNMWKEGRHELVVRYEQTIEEKKGYTEIEDSLLAESPNSRYLGDPFKLFARYRFQSTNRVSWGVTMEKDAGEEFFTGTQKQGFDFYSAHLFLRNIGVIKALAVGDFQAQFGQGLTFTSGLAFGKSANGVGIKRNAQGLRPYTSVDENRFLRGGGVTLGFWKLEVTAFASYKPLDANLSTSTDTLTEVEEQVSSIFSSGFHRTPGELADKGALDEIIYGGNVNFRGKRLAGGHHRSGLSVFESVFAQRRHLQC
jgi:DNA uptake protein ComE-like DNA-binding protein